MCRWIVWIVYKCLKTILHVYKPFTTKCTKHLKKGEYFIKQPIVYHNMNWKYNLIVQTQSISTFEQNFIIIQPTPRSKWCWKMYFQHNFAVFRMVIKQLTLCMSVRVCVLQNSTPPHTYSREKTGKRSIRANDQVSLWINHRRLMNRGMTRNDESCEYHTNSTNFTLRLCECVCVCAPLYFFPGCG